MTRLKPLAGPVRSRSFRAGAFLSGAAFRRGEPVARQTAQLVRLIDEYGAELLSEVDQPPLRAQVDHRHEAKARRARKMNPAERRYVDAALELYRTLVTPTPTVRPFDRRFARELHQQDVSLELLEAALRLALARRAGRPRDAPPGGTAMWRPARSLHLQTGSLPEVRLALSLAPARAAHRGRLTS